MASLVLERVGELSLREIAVPDTLGPHDVRIKMHTVGICGSDVHYYTHGGIGPFVVREPMVLGHEGAGTVVEAGAAVKTLRVGDRVCMEPGIPDPNSRAARLGIYNLDPAVCFWATPPVHGCLTPYVVHAATKARLAPGALAVVSGAGPIGLVTALAALAGGCGRVVITDVQEPKLALAATLGPITPVNVATQDLTAVIHDLTDGWGADVVFEASGNARAAESAIEPLRPGGCIVYIGMPSEPIRFDLVAAQAKEARIETVFRYAHVYPRALELLGSGRIDVKPLLTDRFSFERSVEAFEDARRARPQSVKIQIELPQ